MASEGTGLTQITTAQDKSRAEVEAMRRSLQALVAAAPEIAALKRQMYEEYLKVGFSKDEALVLCQKLTL